MVLSTTTDETNGVIVVSIEGAILFDEESISLRILVQHLLNECGQIVLDLGNVTHIDSGGVGTLVAAYVAARKVGGDIKFANLSDHTKKVLQITKVVRLFEIYGNIRRRDHVF
jgi:anti-sigma B factor antagonist